MVITDFYEEIWECFKQIRISRLMKRVACLVVPFENEVLTIDKSTELEFKDEEAKANWEKWVEANSKDFYGFSAVKYACRWAKYMQHLMKEHNKTLPEIVDKTSLFRYTDDVTGFMYCRVVLVLSQCWKYGEELRRWHNKELGLEDSVGVVNSAMLTTPM